MKNIVESEETFTAYATIDAGHYMLEELYKNIPKRSPIAKMIDEQTGYDKYLDKELAKQALPILKDILKAKKVIDAPTEATEKFITAVKKALK